MSGEYKEFVRRKVARAKGITFFERPINELKRRDLIAAIVFLVEERERCTLTRGGPSVYLHAPHPEESGYAKAVADKK